MKMKVSIVAAMLLVALVGAYSIAGSAAEAQEPVTAVQNNAAVQAEQRSTVCDEAKKASCEGSACPMSACDQAKCEKTSCDQSKCEKPACDEAKCDKAAGDEVACGSPKECKPKGDKPTATS